MRMISGLVAGALALALTPVATASGSAVTSGSPAAAKGPARPGIEFVRIEGKVVAFGLDVLRQPPTTYPWQQGVPGVHVWIDEYPATRFLNVRTDEHGNWSMIVPKRRGTVVDVSIAYEKDFYPWFLERFAFPNGIPSEWDSVRIKSNVPRLTDDGLRDLAMQMPNEIFVWGAKSQLEAAVGDLTGQAYEIRNVGVVTVGKQWASVYDARIPHGVAGATAAIRPAVDPLNGPIYFDETVTPNPALTETSVDGGVLYSNLTDGSSTITAVKPGTAFGEVTFAVEPGYTLFIASPPRSVQSDDATPN